uniref:GYF domain-containing protein n=1 Tax=Psilocybe cubensis TaxID=181762 RepID=A0A8H7YAI1_PSICU
MSTTTMHFGPEWMRTKHQPLSRSQPPPSPPPSTAIQNSGSTYSALVSAMPSASSESGDVVHPFRYSKEELLKIYQEGGGRGGLGLEVERWEGVVREGGTEPATLREMTEAEKKLFAGPLNSELRRRPSQSMEFLSPLNTSGLDRPRLSHNSSTSSNNNSPLRERFGALKRRDSAASVSDTLMPALPRKPSLSALQTPTLSPREPPRSRVGYTPGFDGVLNNGDSWVARRRSSETSMKIGTGSSREGNEPQLGIMGSGIREEKEEDSRQTIQHPPSDDSNAFVTSSPRVHSEDPRVFTNTNSNAAPLQTSSQSSFSVNGVNNSESFPVDRADIGPPPGLVDLAAVEWSYKDPTGQIQGPFRADLMQKWYNDGYFSSDLPMKRVRYDTQWTTVEELSQRAQGENIFLSSTFIPNHTGRGNASPLHALSSSDQLYNEPFQPSPVRTLASSTLDSYLSTGSLASDSPSSSLGASHFGNPSPDPSVFGPRDVKTYFASDSNGRLPGLGALNQPSLFSDRRTVGHEFQANPIMQSPSFGNFVSERDVGFSAYGYNNIPVIHDAWGMSSNHSSAGFMMPRDQGNDKFFPLSAPSDAALRRPEGSHDEHLQRSFVQETHYANEDSTSFDMKQPGPAVGSLGYAHYQYPAQSAFQNAQEQHQQYVTPASEFSENHGSEELCAYRCHDSETAIPQTLQPTNSNSSSTIPSVPWSSLPEEQPATVVETNGHIGSSNNLTNSPWKHVESGPTLLPQVYDSGSPVAAADKVDSWKVDKTEKDLIQQHQTLPSRASEQKKAHTPESSNRTPTPEIVVALPLPTSAPVISKKASKNSSQAIQVPSSAPIATVEPVITNPVVQKVAWAKEEEKKKTGTGSSVSLREIQEAEAKKLESKKAAERERERLARASASADIKEDVQPFTTSWGLPTSQAGARGSAPLKDLVTVPTTPAPAAPPVWTTPLKQATTKKTMKEIQEEEESRKKIALKEITATAPLPKRAYAETTTKLAALPPASSNNGNAWTTVGPSGKATVSPAPPARSSVPGSLAATQTASVSKASATPTSKIATSSVVKKLVKQDDFPETPSHDFLKWLGDSLKGLNSSVNVEEIVSMLLSFPIDPDSTTAEIISDTIYSNSTTLDGRRFASEFIAKRKADALAKAKGTVNSGKASSKPVSIADVVRATPKTTQPEWGFKVVNKKKKGGRS